MRMKGMEIITYLLLLFYTARTESPTTGNFIKFHPHSSTSTNTALRQFFFEKKEKYVLKVLLFIC